MKDDQKNILKIGVVGFSNPQFDQQQAKKLLQQHIFRLIKEASIAHHQVEIVSGLTNTGVPLLAYQLAIEHNLTTVGFSAQQAFKLKCGVFSVDKKFIVGKKFGDESKKFIEYIDCLIRIGGGRQSRDECELFREKYRADGQRLKKTLIEEEIEYYGT